MRKLFKGGKYSREETINYLEVLTAETIQRRKVFKGGNYMRKYGSYTGYLLYQSHCSVPSSYYLITFYVVGQKFVKFFVVFLENLRHQKDILRLTEP